MVFKNVAKNGSTLLPKSEGAKNGIPLYQSLPTLIREGLFKVSLTKCRTDRRSKDKHFPPVKLFATFCSYDLQCFDLLSFPRSVFRSFIHKPFLILTRSRKFRETKNNIQDRLRDFSEPSGKRAPEHYNYLEICCHISIKSE